MLGPLLSILEAYTVRDNAIYVKFNAPVRNRRNEINNADKELDNENNEINNTDNENKLKNFNNLKQELEIVYVIDRFEENYAVCENRETKQMSNVNIYDLPKNVKEGDVLRYKNGEYFLDNNLRQTIEERIQEKTKNIFED